MSRPWMGYFAGAAFALSAAAAATAFAQAAPDDGARHVQREERTVVVRRDGDARDQQVFVTRDGDGRERRMVINGVGGEHHRDMAEHLRTMLQLKPSQEAALTAYLAAVRPAHEERRIVEMSTHGEGKTTPQRLAEMEARMAQQNAAAHARIEATRRFYDQLEPSQKKVFDELPMMMIGPIGPMGPMMAMGPMKIRMEMPPMPPMAPMPAMPRAPHAPPAPPAPPVPPAPPRY